MKKLSIQWRLTIITTLFIALICGCLTLFIYKSGVYYIDSLQDTVNAQNEDDSKDGSEEIYISIPDEKWQDFANDFSIQVYNNKADYRKTSLILSALMALLGGVITFFISGHALKPLSEFSDKIEKVQAQNLAASRIEENKVKELNQLSISYNKMLERLSEPLKPNANLPQMPRMSFVLPWLSCRYNLICITLPNIRIMMSVLKKRSKW